MSQLDQMNHCSKSDLASDQHIGETSKVQEFYDGKTIFITGATGFMGKCLVEKFLRTCPNLKQIYLLIREKKGLTTKERLKKYFEDRIFDEIKRTNPNLMKKVSGMNGNLNSERFGMSNGDIDTLREETNIIYHAAANVMFTPKVKQSLVVNVLGTKKIIELAEQCRQLESFIYLSTAFSHSHMKCIENEFYEPPGDLSLVHKMIDVDERIGIDEKSLKHWTGKFPNIYTFSKAISEELVRQYSRRSNHTCGIYRPSIVGTTYAEPIAGWYSGINLWLALCGVYALGLLHVGHHYLYPQDVIPCDLSISALVALPWDLKERPKAIEKEAIVYNHGSSCVNPVTIRDVVDGWNNAKDLPRSRYAVFMNFVFLTPYWPVFVILDIVFHFIPACLADLVLLIMGKKRRALDVYFKIQKYHDQTDYWSNGNWRIHMRNIPKLMDRLNTVDKELFSCDLKKIDWAEWITRSWRGFLVTTLGEEIPNKKGEERYLLLWIIYYGIIYSFFFAVLYSIYRLYVN